MAIDQYISSNTASNPQISEKLQNDNQFLEELTHESIIFIKNQKDHQSFIIT